MDFDDKPDIVKLAELLRPREEDRPQEDELPNTGSMRKCPKPLPNSSVLSREDQLVLDVQDCQSDGRKQPVYDIIYRQAVTAEDVFLQIGPKTPSSACCEEMLLKIFLPGETFSAMDLKVYQKNIKLEGFLHRLDLDLPHCVDPNKSKAQWDQTEEVLHLTMKLVREFDFVNF